MQGLEIPQRPSSKKRHIFDIAAQLSTKGLKALKLNYLYLIESRFLNNTDIEATKKLNPLMNS